MNWKNPVRSWRRQQQRYSHLNKEVTLVSWTKIDVAPNGFFGSYYVGIFENNEGKRTVGQIVVSSESNPNFVKGDLYRGVLRKLYEDGPEGVITYGVKFRKII